MYVDLGRTKRAAFEMENRLLEQIKQLKNEIASINRQMNLVNLEKVTLESKVGSISKKFMDLERSEKILQQTFMETREKLSVTIANLEKTLQQTRLDLRRSQTEASNVKQELTKTTGMLEDSRSELTELLQEHAAQAEAAAADVLSKVCCVVYVHTVKDAHTHTRVHNSPTGKADGRHQDQQYAPAAGRAAAGFRGREVSGRCQLADFAGHGARLCGRASRVEATAAGRQRVQRMGGPTTGRGTHLWRRREKSHRRFQTGQNGRQARRPQLAACRRPARRRAKQAD